MRITPIVAAWACLFILGCTGPNTPASSAQQAQSTSCEDFARSGGYPVLQGGRVNGGNPNIEKLPGEPPLQLGATDDRHLDEEDYLRNYCNTHS